MIIIALVLAIVSSKLLVKDNLNNECRNYIPNVDKDTKIIIQTQYWDVIHIWIDQLDLCLQKEEGMSNRCRTEICEVKPDETITVKCKELCQFSIGITQDEQLLEIDQELFLITEFPQTTINFQVNQVFKHVHIECELLNYQKDHNYFNYSMVTTLNQTTKNSDEVRRLTRIVKLEEDDYYNFKDQRINAYIVINIPSMAALKLSAIGFNEIREIELFKVIDDRLIDKNNEYLLNLNNQNSYYQNKGIFIKLIQDNECYLSIANGTSTKNQINSIFTSQFTDNSEIYISSDQIQQYGNIYIITVDSCKKPKTYTLKTYVEGLRQDIQCREYIQGMILPNQKINNFILNIDNLNITHVNIKKEGKINVSMIECDSINECYYKKNNNFENNYMNFEINQMKQPQIEILSSSNQPEQFSIKLNCVTPPISLKENQLYQYTSLERTNQTYSLGVSRNELYLIDCFTLQIFKEYGEIGYKNDYESNQWNFTLDEQFFQLQSNLEIIIQCNDPCFYQINYKINRKLIDKIDYRGASLLQFDREVNGKIDNTFSFRLENHYDEIVFLQVQHEQPLNLTLQYFGTQIQSYYSFEQLEGGNFSQQIHSSVMEVYGVLKTNISQQITINLAKIKIIQLEDYEYNGVLKPGTTDVYRWKWEDNFKLIIDSHRKDIKISVCIKEHMISEVPCNYEDVATLHIISLSQSDKTAFVYLTSKYTVDYTIKLQEKQGYITSRKFGKSKSIFLENENQIKYIQTDFQNTKKNITVNLQFQNFIPFKVYCSIRNQETAEFPSKDDYDYTELLYTSSFTIPLEISWPSNLFMLFVFPHYTSQLISIQVTFNIYKIQPATLSFLNLQADSLTYFSLQTESIDIPQLIFEFTSAYPAQFLLEEGCSSRPDISELDQGYDLLANPIVSIHNILPESCYIGALFSPILQTISFRWDQQNYTINTVQRDQIQTFFIHQNESFIDIIYAQPFNITILSDSIITISKKLYQYEDSLIDIMKDFLIEQNQTQSCQYCPLNWHPSLPIGKVVHYGLIVKINDNSSNYYTVISESSNPEYLDLIDEVIFTTTLNKSKKFRANPKSNLTQQLYLRSLKGQFKLLLNNQEYRIENQMKQFEISPQYTLFELAPQSQYVQYELQIKNQFPSLKFGQFYMSKSNQQRYLLPALKQSQLVEIGFSMHHHNQGECQEIIQLFKKQQLIFESKSINGGMIQNFQMDNNTYFLDVTINCYPEMHEGYYLYLRSTDSNMIMIILDTKLKFSSTFLQTQIFFIDLEYQGLYVIEIVQLQGSIVASSTEQLNQLYNGTSKIKTQKLENYYYKLLVDVETLGQLYFNVECFTQSNSSTYDACQYFIEVKRIESLSLELQDLKIGKAIFNSNNTLFIYQTHGIGSTINTIEYLIYYDKLTDKSDQIVDFKSDPQIIQLDDFHGENLYIEAVITYNDGEYRTKILYDPLQINTAKVYEKNQQSYGYVMIVILLALVILLIITIFVYRYKAHILKQKLKYEKSDMRSLATVEVEMPDQSQSE